MLSAARTSGGPPGRVQKSNQIRGFLVVMVAMEWLQSEVMARVPLAEKQRALSEVRALSTVLMIVDGNSLMSNVSRIFKINSKSQLVGSAVKLLRRAPGSILDTLSTSR